MYLFVVVMDDAQKFPDLLASFASKGIGGATVIDTYGMGRVLGRVNKDLLPNDVVEKIISQSSPTNKTIFAVVKSEEKLDEAVGTVRSILGDLGAPGTGIMFSLKLDNFWG